VKGIISVGIPVRRINNPNKDYRSPGTRIRGTRATHLTAMFMRLISFMSIQLHRERPEEITNTPLYKSRTIIKKKAERASNQKK
jgi:hypothetical protein